MVRRCRTVVAKFAKRVKLAETLVLRDQRLAINLRGVRVMDNRKLRGNIIVNAKFICIGFIALAFNTVVAQELITPDKERQSMLSNLGPGEIPDPTIIEKEGIALLMLPIEQQSTEDLEKLASNANKLANLIGMIQKEYSSYYSSNYKYDFIQSAVAPPHDQYVVKINNFQAFRNRSYMNLGEKAEQRGEPMKAFLYYRDAFRLSGFDCESKLRSKTCMRLQAEEKMKKILRINDIESYVSWQK